MKNELDFLIFDPSVISPLYRHSNYAHPLIASEMLKNCGLAEELASLLTQPIRSFRSRSLTIRKSSPPPSALSGTVCGVFFQEKPWTLHRNRRSHMLEEMQQLLAYMDSHYSEDITLSFAAEK
ncbi:MAG: hypothetical protein ACLR6B_00360 [Blautia sp.]